MKAVGRSSRLTETSARMASAAARKPCSCFLLCSLGINEGFIHAEPPPPRWACYAFPQLTIGVQEWAERWQRPSLSSSACVCLLLASFLTALAEMARVSASVRVCERIPAC